MSERKFKLRIAAFLLWTLVASLGVFAGLLGWSARLDAQIEELEAQTGNYSEAPNGSDVAEIATTDPAFEYLRAYIGNRAPGGYREGERIAEAIYMHATANGIDPLLTAAKVQGESTFNPRTTGAVGEYGLSQIHPGWRRWGPNAGISFPQDPYEIEPNIEMGVLIFKRNYDDDYLIALARYNGARNVNGYARKIDRIYREITHGYRLWCVRNNIGG